ncbi:hypothetical protein L1987_11401 [Smallanthus sonchifolius]|uniref:Uncharacterized protein n=1 Tax=Smallanthus sonchifolius TaxID=185202 RepID=A0ACB9JBF0_9ASTR|nr:hypothetical protein L1987_11401 [Smallanthus sonchifolius]
MVSSSFFSRFLPLMILTISCTQNPSNLFANGDINLIQKTCKTTKFYDLCISSLQSDSTSPQADTKGLAIIIAKQAMANATSTNSILSSNILLKNTNDTLMKRVLKQCADWYSAAGASLQSSIQDLGSELYDYAYMHVMAASDYAKSCRNAFKRYPNLVYPPEISAREEGLKHFCDMIMGIIDSLGARLDTASFVLSQFSKLDRAESRVALIDSATNHRVTYGQLRRSIHSLAAGLYHGLGVQLTKQVLDSGAKLAIAAPEEKHKLLSTGVPTLVTTREPSSGNELSVEELIDCCESMVLPENHTDQSDTAAILYSYGTTGTTVPPVILGSLKYGGGGYDLSSLRSVGSGAASLSKHLAHGFRAKFPWVDLKPGYGLTESCGAACFFVTGEEAKARPAASGALLPSFCAKVVDPVTKIALGPNGEGELWLKGQAVMKGYLGNEVATSATIDSDGWLRTGDLCYFDEDGYLFVVDRIRELIKYNGYQVAPYKKIKRVAFINEIPKSVAGKILRKDLMAQSKQNIRSKL